MWPINVDSDSFTCRQVEDFAVLVLLEGAKRLLTTTGGKEDSHKILTAIAESPSIKGLAVIYSEQYYGGEEYREHLESSLKTSSPQIDSGPFAAYQNALIQFLKLLKTFPMPIVVGLDGEIGPDSFGVSMAFDLRIATDRARFTHPNIQNGFPPSPPLAYFLSRSLGSTRAIELILTQSEITSQNAFDLGLISQVVSPEDLESTCLDKLRQLSAIPINSVIETRRLLQPDNDEIRLFLDSGFKAAQRTVHRLKS